VVRALILPVALAIGAVGLAACSDTASVEHTVTQPTVPGGVVVDANATVTIGVRALPSNFNPSTPAGDNRITQMVMEQVWPQPFVTEPSFVLDHSGLLNSAEVQSLSPLVVDYVIDPGATWSDGEPITEADFLYNWHEHLTESAGLPDAGLIAGYRDIASISASAGGRGVTVTFTQPFSQWQALFADLVPAHIAERYGWAAAFEGFHPNRVVSGGPFVISSYTPGRSLVLARNPQYWGTPAHVARIVFVEEPSDAAILAGLRSGTLSIGEIGAASILAKAMAPGVAQVAAAASGAAGGTAGGAASGAGASSTATSGTASGRGGSRPQLAWTGEASSEVWQLAFNLQASPLSDLAVRRGIEHALNRSEIVADSVNLVDSRIRPSLSRLLLTGESSSPSSSTSVPTKQTAPSLYKPGAARRAFAKAGYVRGAGGLLRYERTGRPLRVSLLAPAGDPVVAAAAGVIQGELEAIGVTVAIRTVPLSVLVGRLLPRSEFQLALAPFRLSPTYAEIAPQYSNPVLGPGVSGRRLAGGRGSGASGSGSGSGSTSGSTTTVAAGGPPAPVPNWQTVVPAGTDPGGAATGAVTRDVSGLDDPVVASRFAAALAEIDLPTALADLRQADERLWADVVSIPLFQPGYALVRSVRVVNVSESPTLAGVMWDAEDWVVMKRS
jgi:ABC-type transport system substrate-binding protein